MSPRRNRDPHSHTGSTIGPNLSVSARLRAYFLAGVLLTAPISITLYLGYLFINFIDDRVQALLPARFNPETYLPFSIPGIGVLIMVIALILIGAFTAGFLGRVIVRWYESMLAKIPAVRSIYGATKQILETVLANQSKAFREVVMIEYPRRGIWVLGFITGQTEGEVQNLTEDTLLNIFVPTTPNPTSGFLLFVPKRDCYILNMSVEDGIKMVISAGIVTPPDQRPIEQIEASPIVSRTAERLDHLDRMGEAAASADTPQAGPVVDDPITPPLSGDPDSQEPGAADKTARVAAKTEAAE